MWCLGHIYTENAFAIYLKLKFYWVILYCIQRSWYHVPLILVSISQKLLNPVFANIPSLWVEVLPEAVEWKHGASTVVYFCFHLGTYCWDLTAVWPFLFCFISCIANPPRLSRAGKRETPLTYYIHILSTAKKFPFENDARYKHSDVVLIILDKQPS